MSARQPEEGGETPPKMTKTRKIAMTTTIEIQRLCKTLLSRNPDLGMVGRLIVIKPVQHFLRGIYVDRVGDPHGFRPYCSAICLCAPDADFRPVSRSAVYPPQPGGWDITKQSIGMDFSMHIENDILSKIRNINTFDEYAKYIPRSYDYYAAYELNFAPRIFWEAARGNFDAAEYFCEKFLDELHSSDEILAANERYLDPLDALYPCLKSRNGRKIYDLLHMWEKQSADRLKISHLWQSTPFPEEQT